MTLGVNNGMRRIAWVVTMGLFATLFGCRNGDQRYVSDKDYQKTVASQTAMCARTLALLREQGVTEHTELKLEFFFYTDAEEKAAALSAALSDLGYSVEHGPSAGDSAEFDITGWTTKMPMAESIVVEWTRQMCQVGFDHDCGFDGWGTNPQQE